MPAGEKLPGSALKCRSLDIHDPVFKARVFTTNSLAELMLLNTEMVADEKDRISLPAFPYNQFRFRPFFRQHL